MDLTTFTEMELHDLASQVSDEWERRRASAITDATVTEVITGLQDAGKLPTPASGTDAETAPQWVNPGTDHSAMYHKGAYVTHQGKTWLNNHPHLNHWEPGTLNGGWIDVTPPPIDEDTEEPQVIAWDIGQDVQPGDLRTHQGETWECILAHTTHEGWAPGPATPTVWEPATP